MDLKKFELAVQEYNRRQQKKRSQRLVITGRINATPSEIRKYAQSRGYKEVVFA
jgi:hypothetical protein